MTKTKKYALDIDIAHIVNEVKKNGFYSCFCKDLIGGSDVNNEAILMIKSLAKENQLKVSFNNVKSICIFEDI